MGAFSGAGGGKHRYQMGGWLISNKTANTTQQAAVDGGFYLVSTRTGTVSKWSINLGQVAAGSALSVEISVNGGGAWAALGTVAVGVANKADDPAGAITVTAGQLIGIRYITDASWTSTGADPQTWIEIEE